MLRRNPDGDKKELDNDPCRGGKKVKPMGAEWTGRIRSEGIAITNKYAQKKENGLGIKAEVESDVKVVSKADGWRE